MKKHFSLEGLWYGILMALFFYFMEYWQMKGHVGPFFTIQCCTLPLIGSWYHKKFFKS